MRTAIAVVMAAFVLTACADTSGNSPAAAGGSASASAAPKIYAIGQAMINGAHQSVTVTSFARNYSSGNEFEQPSPGNECVQVNLSLVNGDSTSWQLPLSEMSVISSTGQSYTESFTCGTSSNVDGLAPKGTATAMLLFEVPKGAPLNFTWTPSALNPNSTYQTALK